VGRVVGRGVAPRGGLTTRSFFRFRPLPPDVPFDPLEEGGEDESPWDLGSDLGGNPESDLPGVPEAPSPDTDESDVDPELLATFWRSVLLANVALGGVAVGPMLVYFEGMWVVGSAAVVVGVLAALRVRQHRRAVERMGDERNA